MMTCVLSGHFGTFGMPLGHVWANPQEAACATTPYTSPAIILTDEMQENPAGERYDMPRKPRNPLFKKTDFDRLVEAARAKNLPIHRIDVMRDGLSLIVGEPPPKDGTVPEAEPTPLLQGGAGGR
jgi:hypothetical protein